MIGTPPKLHSGGGGACSFVSGFGIGIGFASTGWLDLKQATQVGEVVGLDRPQMQDHFVLDCADMAANVGCLVVKQQNLSEKFPNKIERWKISGGFHEMKRTNGHFPHNSLLQ